MRPLKSDERARRNREGNNKIEFGARQRGTEIKIHSSVTTKQRRTDRSRARRQTRELTTIERTLLLLFEKTSCGSRRRATADRKEASALRARNARLPRNSSSRVRRVRDECRGESVIWRRNAAKRDALEPFRESGQRECCAPIVTRCYTLQRPSPPPSHRGEARKCTKHTSLAPIAITRRTQTHFVHRADAIRTHKRQIFKIIHLPLCLFSC